VVYTIVMDNILSSSMAEAIYGADKYPLKNCLGEVVELLQAVKNFDKDNILEEIDQVAFDLRVIAFQRFGIDFESKVGTNTYKKFLKRFAVWEKIFEEKGKKFKPSYLKAGSNYAKPEKVIAAFAAWEADPQNKQTP